MENKNPPQTTPYPVNLLPPLISDAVKEVSNNLKIPMDLAAHAALSAISTACQGRINVKFPNFPAASCGLFLWVVSNASHGKSIANERFFRGIAKFEEEYNVKHTVDEKLLKAQLDVWKTENLVIKNEFKKAVRGTDDYIRLKNELIEHGLSEPSKIKHKLICYAQTTSQKLHDHLVSDGEAAIVSPEAGHLILSELFGKPGILSSFWSGEDQAMGLIKGDRKPLHPRLTVSIMTQSNPFHDFMLIRGKNSFSSGLLSRFLISFPSDHETSQAAASVVNEMPEPCLNKFNNRIYEIITKDSVDFGDRACLHFSDNTKIQFEEFQKRISGVIQERKVPHEVEAFYRRMIQHASRMAALFQFFCDETEVIEDYVESAIKLCSWYGGNYDVIFSKYLAPDISDSERYAKKLHDWLEKAFLTPDLYPRLFKGFYRFRDLQNYAGFKGRADELTKAIDTLAASRLINVIPGKKGALTILYPFQEQAANFGNNYYSLGAFNPANPPVQYPRSSACAPSAFFNLSAFIDNYKKNYWPRDTNNSMVTINPAVNSPEIESIQEELQEKANKHRLGNMTISAKFDKNNS